MNRKLYIFDNVHRVRSEFKISRRYPMGKVEEVMIDGKKRKAIRCTHCGNLMILEEEERLNLVESLTVD